MKRISIIITALTFSIAHPTSAQNILQCMAENEYTVIANPGEHAADCIRINWHTDTDSGKSYCTYTKRSDSNWKQTRKIKAATKALHGLRQPFFQKSFR